MGKRSFTNDQLSAINTRDKTLLVSAAAGSGKTATLIERIIQSILDPHSPIDINRMLIVTFTNAAADELRAKITNALREKLKEDPENSRLEKQLYLLPSANISTIDAFCNNILKNNTERFGVSPRYRIADPIEAKILSHTIWSALIDAAYADDIANTVTPVQFEELASALTSVKLDSELEEVFENLYEHSKSHERGVEIFKDFAELLENDISLSINENRYVKFAMRRAREIAAHYLALYAALRKDFSADSTDDVKYFRIFDSDSAKLLSIKNSEDYQSVKEALALPFDSLPRVSKKEENHLTLISARDELKAALSACLERYFSFTEAEWKEKTAKLCSYVKSTANFIELFDSVYFEEKRQRGILEYSDIERLTYRSLYNSDGTLTEFALATRAEYDAVYIDEYQDVNALQNKIFEAISTETDRFMVGDIKQSIYVFRSARPDIFADMKNSFPPLDAAQASARASIFMSENFRCDEAIIDFVNSVFDKMFSLFGESIGYVPSDRLKYSKVDNTANEKIPPEICLFASGDGENSEDESDDPCPAWISNKIKELIKNGEKLNSGKEITPGDIAIILRKDRGRSKIYADALEKNGISAKAPDDKSFFLNSEIQLALCLLNTVDNPRRDIYLAGLMLSPLFSFTADELYLIRRFGASHVSLWQSLTKYCEDNPDYVKGASFINTINRYRAICEGLKVDTFILRLYHETGLLALAKKEGRDENLMLLYNYARKFEASSFEGLYNFINYVNEVIESNSAFSAASSDSGENAVTIITAHKSKGLEYPIVFIADAEAALVSQMERRVRVSFSDELGIAMKTRTEDGLALVENPIHNVIIDRNIEKCIEEELRVYYVALTRARERLFIAGKIGKNKTKDAYLDSMKLKKLTPSRQTLWELKSLIDIVMLPATNASVDFKSYEQVDGGDSPALISANQKLPCESFESAYKTLTERLTFKYPHVHMTTLPEKMSVSRLYPAVLDEMDAETSLSIDAKESPAQLKLGRLPEFISGSPEQESARRGIATHTFLQFFDIESFNKTTPEKELERLVKCEFISKENAARVRISEINLFKNSALYKEMTNAARLLREFRFSVMLPASLFTQSEEKKAAYAESEILLQGVIDCLIEDTAGNLHLVDYKTDRLSKEELNDKSLAEKRLSEKHALQLSYYSLAIEKIFGKKPKTKRIYSLPLGDTVDV